MFLTSLDHHRSWSLASLLAVVLGIAGSVMAATGPITYQGRLTNDSGQPVTGSYDFKFTIFRLQTLGTALSETLTREQVDVVDGLFAVHDLDFDNVGTANDLFTSYPHAMEIQVKRHDATDYETLSPRARLTASPFALGLLYPFAGVLDGYFTRPMLDLTRSLGSAPVLSLKGEVQQSSVLLVDNVHTGGAIEAVGSTTSPGFLVRMSCSGNARVLDITGMAVSPNSALKVTNTDSGAGAHIATRCNGSEAAVKVFNEGTGYGVYAQVTAPHGSMNAGPALRGRTVILPPPPQIPVAPEISPEQFAARGGETAAFASPAVPPRGNRLPTVGLTTEGDDLGMVAAIGLDGGRAVQAHAHTNNSIAVFGTTDRANGDQGIATNAIGVKGYSYLGTAVVGESPNGVAGRFIGDVEITGSVAVNGLKQFRIAHPLDPVNKTLSHACVESDQMRNVYDGVVRLDQDGQVWVELPDWFEALNGDFRYQLTAIGGSAPNLHIASEIQDNRFQIAGGQSGMKVCWQVTGIRHDEFARTHPLQVVQDVVNSRAALPEVTP